MKLFYVDPAMPGVVRGGFFGAMGGILVGQHAQWVCDAMNAKLEAEESK